MPPGPPPKRDAERRRNNPRAVPTEQVDVAAVAAEMDGADDPDSLPFKIAQPIEVPVFDGSWDVEDAGQPDPATEWHPLVANLWDSFSRSGQALYWQPSDWAVAAFVCEALDRDLKPQIIGYREYGEGDSHVKEPIWGEAPVKGASVTAYLKAAATLMLTEGERRRLSLELTSRYADVTPKAPPTEQEVADRRAALFAVPPAASQ